MKRLFKMTALIAVMVLALPFQAFAQTALPAPRNNAYYFGFQWDIPLKVGDVISVDYYTSYPSTTVQAAGFVFNGTLLCHDTRNSRGAVTYTVTTAEAKDKFTISMPPYGDASIQMQLYGITVNGVDINTAEIKARKLPPVDLLVGNNTIIPKMNIVNYAKPQSISKSDILPYSYNTAPNVVK